MTAAAFEGWAVLELLGHRIRYGRVSEATLFGEPFVRIDMPTDPPTSEFYAGKSVYGLRPSSEATIRAYYAPRRALAAPRSVAEHTSAGHRRAFDEDEDDFDERDVLVSNVDADGEPIAIERCGGCELPLAVHERDDFETVPRGGKLWHARCAAARDVAIPEPIEGGA